MEDERTAIASGHSKLIDPYQSKHVIGPKRSLSLAVDVAPYPVVWPTRKPGEVWTARDLYALARFYHFAGVVTECARLMSIPIRFGGDWDGDNDFTDQSFDDLDHFELVV